MSLILLLELVSFFACFHGYYSIFFLIYTQRMTIKIVNVLFLLSGSVLLSCAHFGAHVMGGDIDHTLLHGRGTQTIKKCCLFFFFCKQYAAYNSYDMYFFLQ